MVRVEGSGVGVWGLGFGVWGLGFGVCGLGWGWRLGCRRGWTVRAVGVELDGDGEAAPPPFLRLGSKFGDMFGLKENSTLCVDRS